MFRGPRVVRRRPLLRAAVVGGTSYAAGRAAGRRTADAEGATAYQDQQAAAPVPPQGGTDSSMMDQLSQLAKMHQQGALTDEEFATAKAKLLG